MAAPLDIVDVHTHLWPPAWAPGGEHARNVHGIAPEIAAKIADPGALLGEFAAAGVGYALVSATVETLFGATGPVDHGLIPEVNDWLARLVAAHPGRIGGLAVVDAFSGNRAATEAERAIVQLGLSGLVIDSSRDGKFLADLTVRPVLDVAAAYRVPVFVHPVAHLNAEMLITGAGAWGNSLGRGLMNGVAFLSVLQARLVDELPDLQLIFATLGLGGVVQAARGGRFARDAERPRPNIYFDTMGHDPRIVRALTGYFGADRVLAGTDWPILPALSAATLGASLAEAGLDDAGQRLVAGGNARRLLALRRVDARAAE